MPVRSRASSAKIEAFGGTDFGDKRKDLAAASRRRHEEAPDRRIRPGIQPFRQGFRRREGGVISPVAAAGNKVGFALVSHIAICYMPRAGSDRPFRDVRSWRNW